MTDAIVKAPICETSNDAARLPRDIIWGDFYAVDKC